MDVVYSLKPLAALTMTPQCHLGSAMYYSVRVNPYAYSKHIKVLKHIVSMQYGCGMQSEASCSLNHDTPASFGFAHTPIFQNLAPTPLTGITV